MDRDPCHVYRSVWLGSWSRGLPCIIGRLIVAVRPHKGAEQCIASSEEPKGRGERERERKISIKYEREKDGYIDYREIYKMDKELFQIEREMNRLRIWWATRPELPCNVIVGDHPYRRPWVFRASSYRYLYVYRFFFSFSTNTESPEKQSSIMKECRQTENFIYNLTLVFVQSITFEISWSFVSRLEYFEDCDFVLWTVH